ncbi:MAG: hypothetical protein M3494_13200, partial [Actinomycetota bacterium]|nr:hypothetical protein [Actinomycetota bacterium]
LPAASFGDAPNGGVPSAHFIATNLSGGEEGADHDDISPSGGIGSSFRSTTGAVSERTAAENARVPASRGGSPPTRSGFRWLVRVIYYSSRWQWDAPPARLHDGHGMRSLRETQSADSI